MLHVNVEKFGYRRLVLVAVAAAAAAAVQLLDLFL